MCTKPAIFGRSLSHLRKLPSDYRKKPSGFWKNPSGFRKKTSNLQQSRAANANWKSIPNRGINLKMRTIHSIYIYSSFVFHRLMEAKHFRGMVSEIDAFLYNTVKICQQSIAICFSICSKRRVDLQGYLHTQWCYLRLTAYLHSVGIGDKCVNLPCNSAVPLELLLRKKCNG